MTSTTPGTEPNAASEHQKQPAANVAIARGGAAACRGNARNASTSIAAAASCGAGTLLKNLRRISQSTEKTPGPKNNTIRDARKNGNAASPTNASKFLNASGLAVAY